MDRGQDRLLGISGTVPSVSWNVIFLEARVALRGWRLISCAKPVLPWHLLIWCGGDSTRRSLRLPPTWGWCHQPSHEPSASSFPSPSLLQPTGCLVPGTVASCTCGPGFLPHAVPSTCSHGLVGMGSAWWLWHGHCDTPQAQSFTVSYRCFYVQHSGQFLGLFWRWKLRGSLLLLGSRN